MAFYNFWQRTGNDMRQMVSVPDQSEITNLQNQINNITPGGFSGLVDNGDSTFTHTDGNGNSFTFDINCVKEGTCAQIESWANNGTLDPGCIYKATDVSWIIAGGTACFYAHALDESTISEHGYYVSPILNPVYGWDSVIDWNAHQIEEIYDSVNDNRVKGSGVVRTFPFGNANVQNNDISEGTFTYTGGVFDNNTAEDADFNITGGNVQSSTFAAESNLTISGGSVDNIEMETNANLNIANGSINDSTLANESNTVINGGQVGDTYVGQDSSVTINSGSHLQNSFEQISTYNQTGTGTINDSVLSRNSNVQGGNVNITDSEISDTSLNMNGSTGTFDSNHVSSAVLTSLQNIPNLFIQFNTINDRSSISANGATQLRSYSNNLSSYGRIIASAGTITLIEESEISSNSYIQNISGTLDVDHTEVTSTSYIYNANGVNLVQNTNISAQSRVRFLNTSTGNRVYYSVINSGSLIEARGASINNYFYYNRASGLSAIYTQDSSNARMYYNTADATGSIYSLRNSATHYMYYNSTQSRGYVYAESHNNTFRMYANNANSVSRIRMRGTGGNLYYNSATAYYYMYITRNGGTSSGLFGQGRRSFTVTNPVVATPYAVGGSWQNFN